MKKSTDEDSHNDKLWGQEEREKMEGLENGEKMSFGEFNSNCDKAAEKVITGNHTDGRAAVWPVRLFQTVWSPSLHLFFLYSVQLIPSHWLFCQIYK